MRIALRKIEWTLLVVIGGLAVFNLLHTFDLFDRDTQLSEAKKKGYYYKVDADAQTYFGMRVNVDGVIYGEGKLTVYLSTKDLFSVPLFPNRIQVTTDSGEVLSYRTSSGSTGYYKSTGHFTFEQVPENLKSITVHQEAYGQSLSFLIPLEGGSSK
ncbi:hypothetical protein [Paenibacillus sinopodophylli]|uniref:hypothetical protein n=1 Tax=Paenibacillus sinopodophylli TaxID=1837342 RepID=UPI00110CA39D|nr:hypothetical protein [Paenibacillus sinopodophylli]